MISDMEGCDMGHKIVEAIIENGKVEYVDEVLPSGKIRVHLIYDTEEESATEAEIGSLLADTAGIYKGIDAEVEAKNLRQQWERETWR
jgi:hypothetical protein